MFKKKTCDRKRFRFQLKFKLSFRFSRSAKFLSDQFQSSDLFPKLNVSNDYIYKHSRTSEASEDGDKGNFCSLLNAYYFFCILDILLVLTDIVITEHDFFSIAFSVLFAKWLTIFSSTHVSEQI